MKPRRRALARLLALLAAVALVAAACGNDDDDTATGPAQDQATADAEATDEAMDDEAMDEGAMEDGDHDHGDEGHDHGDDGHDHAHGNLEWDAGEAPTLTVEVVEDPMTGWNLFATVDGYQFAPENASTEHVPGEGHAHINVNGERLARVYGPSYHIASLAPGTNEITFELSANTHDVYTVDGEPLAQTISVEVPDGGGGHGHDHGDEREWDGGAEPAVSVEVVQDPKSGWNVFADVTGFTITPQNASTEHVAGEGHMHIYVNGERLGRLYETAFHLAELPAGANEISVRLSGNDHADYALDGALIQGAATIEVSEADGAEEVGADAPADHVIEASFEGGQVVTADDRYEIGQGDLVEVLVTSDVAEEVHVHGYDLFGNVGPDSPATVRFVADLPGVWEVELESMGRLLFELEVS